MPETTRKTDGAVAADPVPRTARVDTDDLEPEAWKRGVEDGGSEAAPAFFAVRLHSELLARSKSRFNLKPIESPRTSWLNFDSRRAWLAGLVSTLSGCSLMFVAHWGTAASVISALLTAVAVVLVAELINRGNRQSLERDMVRRQAEADDWVRMQYRRFISIYDDARARAATAARRPIQPVAFNIKNGGLHVDEQPYAF